MLTDKLVEGADEESANQEGRELTPRRNALVSDDSARGGLADLDDARSTVHADGDTKDPGGEASGEGRGEKEGVNDALEALPEVPQGAGRETGRLASGAHVSAESLVSKTDESS